MPNFLGKKSVVSATFACLVGILTCQQLPSLPPVYWIWPLIPLVVWGILRGSQPIYLASCIAAGFIWTFSHASLMLSKEIDPGIEGKDITVEGFIHSLPVLTEHGSRFEFRVQRLIVDEKTPSPPNIIGLAWYKNVPKLSVGDAWRFQVRLKRPHGQRNPGSFDQEAWLFQRGVRATGYVRDSAINQQLSNRSYRYTIDRWRSYLAEQIKFAMEGSPFSGMVTALAIGDARDISRVQWDVFRRTGTTHLISISGLHISLVAMLVFTAIRWSWARSSKLVSFVPAQIGAAFVAVMVATVYAVLAGLSVPTQRAWIMVGVVMTLLVLRRNYQPSHILGCALFAVLLFDPFAVMSVGFWLSFAAVAIIFLVVNGRFSTGGLWWKWGRLHWIMTFAMAPLLVLFFQQASLISPLANFIAVPWVSFVVTPLALLGSLCMPLFPPLATLLLKIAGLSMFGLWPLLEWLANVPIAVWNVAMPSLWVLIVGLVGVLLLLLPRGVPIRWLGIVWLMPLVLIERAPQAGEVWFTLLDVGQGLAAVAQTSTHTLVFDTGARFSKDSDAGNAIVVPFLRQAGIDKLDVLVVSHADNDHSGGARSITDEIPVAQVLASDVKQISWLKSDACEVGQQWVWDGVSFEMMNPPPGVKGRENNLSCVLRISNGYHAILLTGDIEAKAERWLVRNAAEMLNSDVLVAPHHGSKTSSTEEFLQAVQPRYALFPVGYRNRFGFPKQTVLQRYQERGIQTMDTASEGAIRFDVSQNDAPLVPHAYRRENLRYWHSR